MFFSSFLLANRPLPRAHSRFLFCSSPNRSVYLHNNKLSDAGLPDNMFNGSDNVEILIMSSNFLKYVPKNLPPALYKLHLKVTATRFCIPLGLCQSTVCGWESNHTAKPVGCISKHSRAHFLCSQLSSCCLPCPSFSIHE